MNRAGRRAETDPFFILAANVGGKVLVGRESVTVDMGDPQLWSAAQQLLGHEYIHDANRGIFQNVDQKIIEALRDYPAGHC